MAPRKKRKLDDGFLQSLVEFNDEMRYAGTIWDTDVLGLRIRIGKFRHTWSFFQEHSIHGKRSSTFRRLGFFPQMLCSDARKQGLIVAGSNAAGHIQPGRRQALKFEQALATYVGQCRARSARKGKLALWATTVARWGTKYLLPEFGRWPLSDLSNNPAHVAAFHERITRDHGPVIANRLAAVITSVFKNASRLDRSLPPAMPTSAVVYNTERPREVGIAFRDFPRWLEAWRRIENPVRRAYHLASLLLGARPTELGRVEWRDINTRARSLTFRNAKAGADVIVPLSIAIVRAFKMARDHAEPGAGPNDLVFPQCIFNLYRDKLPVHSHGLRHVYRSVATDLGMNEVAIRLLMGHSLRGVSQDYISQMMMQSGPSLRQTQRLISRRIVSLLGLTI